MLEWVQTTSLASTISNSLTLTAILSSIHLVGLTLVVGSVLFASLRLVGLTFDDRAVNEVTAAVGGTIALGLVISVTSGLLLFAPRAAASFSNGFFQFKMASLVAAVVFHVGVYRPVLRNVETPRWRLRLTGAIGFGLWLSVAVAGCLFILLESRHMTLLTICEWLENTQVAVLVRESAYGFPIVVAIHILGLIVSVGLVLWFDLRLLGVSMQRCRLSDVWRRLMPWALSGFVVMFVSGGLLFTAFATSAYGNLAFRIKSAAIILAGINALVYHLVTERGIAEWDVGVRPPRSARLAGLLSIVLWTTVILSGRMMSYTMF